MRLGIFFCTCNDTININFKTLKKQFTKDVEIIEITDQLCQRDLDYIVGDLKRKKLNSILICCTEKKEIFKEFAENCDIFFLNLKEHCGWVHEKKEATEKAKCLVRATLEEIDANIELEDIKVDVGFDVLVVGGTSGLNVANYLSNVADVHFLADNLNTNFGKVVNLEHLKDVKVHIGDIKDVCGNIGNFEVEIESKIDLDLCTSCGLCEEVCEKGSIKQDIVYIIDDSCDRCKKCIEKCPVGAIEFERTKIINVGQILAINQDRRWDFTRQFGIYLSDEENAFSQALTIASNLGVILKPLFLDLDLEGCASARSGYEGCGLCLECPHDCVVRKEDKVVFSEISCQGCGFCSSVCPISLPTLKEYKRDFIYSKIESLLSADLDKNILLFACNKTGLSVLDYVGKRKLKYPAVLPIFVPCINSVSETDVLTAFNLGADGVILLFGCRDCNMQKRTKDRAKSVIDFSNKFLSAFSMGERVFLCDVSCPEDFLEGISKFYSNLTKLPIKKGVIPEGNKREVLLGLTQYFSDKTGVIPSFVEEETIYPFADIKIDTNCTICDACAGACTSNALRASADKIDFVYGYCIACGLCEKICPENALNLNKILDFSKLVSLDEVNLSKSELIECAVCGKEYISKSAFDRMVELLRKNEEKNEFDLDLHLELLRYCENCRPLRAIEKFGK